jgi:methanogenic corrinoid protein MtbC1
MDLEEATDVAEEFLKSCKSLERLFDRVIVPALTLAEKDRHQGTLDDVRQQFIFQNTRILVEDITERADEITDGKTHEKGTEANSRLQKEAEQPCVVCIPARDQVDEIAAFLLSQLLGNKGFAAKALSSGVLVAEALAAVEGHRPEIVCVAAVPPFGFMHARYLCRRIRGQFQ